jgi:hypothetical protein
MSEFMQFCNKDGDLFLSVFSMGMNCRNIEAYINQQPSEFDLWIIRANDTPTN